MLNLVKKPGLVAAGGSASPPSNAQPLSIKSGLFNLKTIGSFALSLVVIIFFILTVKIDVGSIVTNVSKADWGLLLVALGIYYGTFYIRGMRWEVLLRRGGFEQEAGVKLPKTSALSRIVFISWFVNCLVPARLGDAYRSYLLKKRTRASISRSFGTVVAERVVDLISLMLLLCVSGFIAFSSGVAGEVLQQFAWVFAAGIAVALALVVALVTVKYWIHWLLRFVPSRYKGLVLTFQEGLSASLHREDLLKLYGLTGLIWLAEAARLFFVMASLHVTGLSFAIVLFVALLGSLLSIVPFTPSGLGAVEGGLVLVLTAFSLEKGLASSIVLVDRLISYWSNIAVGAPVYLMELKKSTK